MLIVTTPIAINWPNFKSGSNEKFEFSFLIRRLLSVLYLIGYSESNSSTPKVDIPRFGEMYHGTGA